MSRLFHLNLVCISRPFRGVHLGRFGQNVDKGQRFRLGAELRGWVQGAHHLDPVSTQVTVICTISQSKDVGPTKSVRGYGTWLSKRKQTDVYNIHIVRLQERVRHVRQ